MRSHEHGLLWCGLTLFWHGFVVLSSYIEVGGNPRRGKKGRREKKIEKGAPKKNQKVYTGPNEN